MKINQDSRFVQDDDTRESIEVENEESEGSEEDPSYRPSGRNGSVSTRSTKGRHTTLARGRPKAIIRPVARVRERRNRPAKISSIPGPLSEITEGSSVPIKDIAAYVNRPFDLRREERQKKNGHVVRPMNSFMLYRSAFAERAKEWCKGNNHQVVSSLAGESWLLETDEIRAQFAHWAAVEKANHAAAFPAYKYSPSKTATKRRAVEAFESSDDGSLASDQDYAPSRQAVRRRLALAHLAPTSMTTLFTGSEHSLLLERNEPAWYAPAPAPPAAPTSFPAQFAAPSSGHDPTSTIMHDSPMSISQAFVPSEEAFRQQQVDAYVAPIVPSMGPYYLHGLGIYADATQESVPQQALHTPTAWARIQEQDMSSIPHGFVYDPFSPLQEFFVDAMPAVDEEGEQDLKDRIEEEKEQFIDPMLLMQSTGQ